jgi:hypothetical protein
LFKGGRLGFKTRRFRPRVVFSQRLYLRVAKKALNCAARPGPMPSVASQSWVSLATSVCQLPCRLLRAAGGTQGFEPLCERPLPRAVQAVEQAFAAAIAEAVNVSKLCRIEGQPIEQACD